MFEKNKHYEKELCNREIAIEEVKLRMKTLKDNISTGAELIKINL